MDSWLVFFSMVVLLGVLAQWLAWMLRIPSILPLLVFGFVSGQFVRFPFEESVLFAVVSLSVAIIMLEGGLTLKYDELGETGGPLLRLVTIGVAITWILSALAFHFVAGFTWKASFLVGAILTVTGPTVIGPLLRNVRPTRRLNSILKWEGIVIDPIGAILAVLVFGALFGHSHQHETNTNEINFFQVLRQLTLTILIGCGFGFGAGKALLFVLKRHWVPDYLQSIVVLGVALALFTLSNLLQHESGLLTVTLLGIVLVNQSRTPIRPLIEFKENLRVLLISCLFIVLGGRIGWEEIAAVWKEALIIVSLLILIVRPASVYLSCLGTDLTFRERTFIALLAPRGIVAAAISAIFAIELSHFGGAFAADAARIPPIIFCVIFGTVSIYGIAAGPLAKQLKLATPNPQGLIISGARPWTIEAAAVLKEEGYRIVIIDRNHQRASEARMKGIPAVTANVLSDYAVEDLDLSGIGRFLAMTENDEVNSLACIGFSHPLGRSNVYQIEPQDSRSGHRTTSSFELIGRPLFGEGITSSFLDENYSSGFKVKTTLITDNYSFDDFVANNVGRAVPMFIIRSNGDLSIISGDSNRGTAGDRVVSLVKNLS